ncbi:MAG: xcpT 2, partial [Verrucomicrobia bacterium]|nr:xcpT 2 [Verrucomicrobiota bacterium]
MHRARAIVGRNFGFTLIELLVVIGLVATLAGISLGAARGGREQASVNRARAELALLGEMLEAYRREYGDYPQTAETPENFFDALRGRRGPDGNVISARSVIGAVHVALRETDESAAA